MTSAGSTCLDVFLDCTRSSSSSSSLSALRLRNPSGPSLQSTLGQHTHTTTWSTGPLMEHKHSGADVGRRRSTARTVHTRNVLSDTWNRSNDDSVRHKHSNLHDRSTLQYGTLSHERPIRMASISERDIQTGQPPSTSSMHASRHTPLSHDRVLLPLSLSE